MVFSSPVFLFLFLPLVLLLVLTAGTLRARNTILTVASLFFYAWGETFHVWVMLVSILMNYLMGICLGSLDSPSTRKLAVIVAVLLNLGLLVWFKYANFIMDNVGILLPSLFSSMLLLDPVHLPIGISFFTFQSLSYVIDVYRGQIPTQWKLGKVALYISLFPQLIAGPIVRYTDVLSEIDGRKIDLANFASGVRRFIVGLGKKLLIADTIARVADPIFGIPDAAMPVSVAWLGALAYGLQIYFDFSGYSDMAIGLGRMFGFNFLENFNFPYSASSVREFWQRWHISLTTWFRDYLYIPLGGSRGGTFQTYRNLVFIFFITGLWHGASWNFVIWGMCHGFFMVFELAAIGRSKFKLPKAVGVIYVLLVVNVAWVFFRAPDLEYALNFLRSMFAATDGPLEYVYPTYYLTTDVVLAFVIGTLASFPLLRNSAHLYNDRKFFSGLIAYTTVPAYALILLLCAMHMANSTYSPFIYFRF